MPHTDSRQLLLLNQHCATYLIHTNIQPLRQFFFTRGRSYRSRSKIYKHSCRRDNLKHSFWITFEVAH